MTHSTFKADLTNCDKEPIHIPGSIQPHGAMLVCSPVDGQVLYVSANAGAFLGDPDRTLVGETLGHAIGESAAHDLRNAAAKAGGSSIAGALMGRRLPGLRGAIDLTIHRHNDLLFVELEKSSVRDDDSKTALELTQSLVRRLSLETDVEKIAVSAAKLVRAMLGYDRVMVYRFLHNGAGRVIGEAKRAGLHSFMGQHFPASDIPAQARRLYLLNTIRSIGDSNYTPIPLIPSLPPGGAPIDMSYAHLRSVSPIHCEYLRNMGVGASLSISIVIDDALWGLIACHHDTPKVISIPLRLGAELFGQYLSLQIALGERRAAFVAANQARERLDKIVKALMPEDPVDEILRDRLGELASLIQCDGAGLWINGAWTTFGTVPAKKQIGALIDFLKISAGGNVWRSSEMRTQIPLKTTGGETVAGVLAIPISSLARDYVIFFRGEESQNVEWAGEPMKSIVHGPSGARLTPRGSFETWREEVKGQSKPWTEAEQVIAESVRTYLRDVVLRHSEAMAEERARVEHRRRVLNDELNHRVKNIIAVVKSIALQTGATATTVQEYSSSLEGRLRALAFAHDQSLSVSGGDLKALLDAEAGLHREHNQLHRVQILGPAIGLNDRSFAAVALLIHEMMTNAAKYGALSAPGGSLKIEWSLNSDGDCVIHWIESGGPEVKPPKRRGFGSKLIQSAVSYDLGGSAQIDYAKAGLRGTFSIPSRHLKEIGEIAALQSDIVVNPAIFKGIDVLLVEDQALIAMDTEDVLSHLGVGRVRALPNTAEALAALENTRPDCAILDFNLGGETSAALADELTTLNIPFIFVTGYGDSVMIPRHLASVPVVRKPVNGPVLAEKLSTVLEAQQDKEA